MSATRLIINADDLGAGSATDRGIFQAFSKGVVSSASLLANGPSFAAAASTASALGLPIGVHLNLADGEALSGPIPGLTDAAGHFPGKARLRTVLATGRVDEGALRKELLAQVERVVLAGLAPDHLDTHQHTFLFPALTTLVLEIARSCGIEALRLPQPAEAEDEHLPEPLAAEVSLYRRLAPAACRALRASGLCAPDGLYGMPLLNRLTEERLCELLRALPAGTWELMVHPGELDRENAFSGLERPRELAALTSLAVRALLDERRIALITFGELPCVS
jgi:chitin disaccharide deacetylase